MPGWEKSERVALARALEPEAGDSGWLIMPPGAVSGVPPEQFPVFELLRRRSELLSAMALPGGWVVEFEEDEILGYGKPG
nr:hypothetical protein [Stigmatella erecta]